MTVAAAPLPPSERDRRSLRLLLRFITGLALLAVLAFFLWTPGDWANKVFVWVLLTILADECAGWFGYAGLAMGALIFFAPGTPPEQWFVVLPLIGGALFALLLLKHSGGPFVLPFAGAIFAGAVLLAEKLGTVLKTPIKLVTDPKLQQMAVLAMLIGLGFSFLRQIISMLLRWQKRRRQRILATAAAREASAGLPPTPVPAADASTASTPAPAPTTQTPPVDPTKKN